MSVTLPQVLRENMDKWEYNDDGEMVACKGASFEVVKAIKEMNELEANADSDMIIDD